MKVIIVSGTPGTGKTTIAREIARKNCFKYVDVNKLVKENKLDEGYDEKRETKIVDTDRLCSFLIGLIETEKNKKTKGLVIDSHLSHYLPKKYVDKCIITKCSLPLLKKRLEKRGYSKEKVRENLDAEIFDICRIEALEAGHKAKIIQTG